MDRNDLLTIMTSIIGFEIDIVEFFGEYYM